MGKMRKLSQIVPFFSDFSPISYQFHTFLYITQSAPLAISHHSPIFAGYTHFSPFPLPPLSPIFPSTLRLGG